MKVYAVNISKTLKVGEVSEGGNFKISKQKYSIYTIYIILLCNAIICNSIYTMVTKIVVRIF